MRENDTDGEGGWPPRQEQVSPQAPRGQDEAAGTRWPGAPAAPPPENGDPDTLVSRYRPGSRVPLTWVGPGGRRHTAVVTLAAGPAG